jgi:hypothetical protein
MVLQGDDWRNFKDGKDRVFDRKSEGQFHEHFSRFSGGFQGFKHEPGEDRRHPESQ